MSSTIPYDASLVLGNIVPQKKLDILLQIADLQAPIDAAQEELNLYILEKRSLEMTRMELVGMKISASDLDKPLKQLSNAILQAAKKLASAQVTAGPKITELKSKISQLHESPESPVDYNKTLVKKDLPLSFDSLKLNAQYFSFDKESQSADSTIGEIRSFVSASGSFLGAKFSGEMSKTAQRQVSSQLEYHDLEGTLVITAGCTHKNAAVLAPFILDVDKAIRVWNLMFKDKIKTNDPSNLIQIAQQQETEKEQKFNILSGATYGSSFVGMVHILKEENTESDQKMISTAQSKQLQMKIGSWLKKLEGGFGVDSSFSSDVKNMLSSQEISSHISLITTGCIPSIKSSEVQIGVKQFANFDPATMMQQLATLATATTSAQETVQTAAQAALTGGQMESIRAADITSVMSGLATIDDGKNKMLDINSLMTAFEDYVTKASGGEIGVPINYYIKPITKSQLAQMWVAKYYPDSAEIAISGDDSGSAKAAGSSTSSSTTGGTS